MSFRTNRNWSKVTANEVAATFSALALLLNLVVIQTA
jgi:hypothetical protein